MSTAASYWQKRYGATKRSGGWAWEKVNDGHNIILVALQISIFMMTTINPAKRRKRAMNRQHRLGLNWIDERITCYMIFFNWSLSFFIRFVFASIFYSTGFCFCSTVSCSSLMFLTFCLSPLMPTVISSIIRSRSASFFFHFLFCYSSYSFISESCPSEPAWFLWLFSSISLSTL